MGPVDRRLLRQAGAARGYLTVAAGLGLAGAALILVQADLLSRALAGAARGTGASALAAVLAWLAVVLAGRAVTAAGGEAAALRAAAAAGVWVDGVAAHRAPGGRGAGVLIGYANLAETAIARGVALLGAAIASADG